MIFETLIIAFLMVVAIVLILLEIFMLPGITVAGVGTAPGRKYSVKTKSRFHSESTLCLFIGFQILQRDGAVFFFVLLNMQEDGASDFLIHGTALCFRNIFYFVQQFSRDPQGITRRVGHKRQHLRKCIDFIILMYYYNMAE